MKINNADRASAPHLSGTSLHVKWAASLVHAGPYPIAYKRFYKLETLTNAIEKLLHEKDRFIFSTLASLAEGRPIASLLSDLVYEDTMRLVFSLTLTTRTRKQIPARLVVAKNHAECTAALAKECTALTYFSEHCPESVVCPVRYGFIYLPDRYQRKEVQREVFAYLYKSPADLTPLYVASPTQLGPRGLKPSRYALKETEVLKASIISVIAACYDEKTFSGISPKDLLPESFALRTPKARDGRLLLIQCPQVQNRLRSGQLIEKILFGTLRNEKVTFPIAPTRPEAFFEVLKQTVSEEKAREWCNAFLVRYKAHVKISHLDTDVSLPGRDYLHVLEGVVNR